MKCDLSLSEVPPQNPKLLINLHVSLHHFLSLLPPPFPPLSQ